MSCIIFDVDGVILDYFKHFQSYMRLKKGIAPVMPYDRLPSSFGDIYPAHLLKGQTIGEIVAEMALNERYFSTIPFVHGAISSISRLAEKGHEIHLLTSCGNHELTIAARRKNLSSIMPAISSFSTLPLGASKADILRSFPDGSLFFDDHVRNCREAQKLGLVPFHVIPPGLSKGKTPFRTLSGWKEILQSIEEHIF